MRLLVVLWLLACPLAARADMSTNPEAEQHIQAGLAAYGAKDYPTASREFEAAYKLDPLPPLLWSWAQSERLDGNCPHALELYRKYLEADISPTQTTATREQIKICEQQVQAAPPDKPPPPPPEQVSPAATPRRWYLDPLAGGLTVAGLAGITVGIVFFSKSSTSRARADNAMMLDEFERALDDATSQRRIGAVSLSVGAALLAGGVAVYVLRKRSEDRLVNPTVVSTDGRSLFITGWF